MLKCSAYDAFNIVKLVLITIGKKFIESMLFWNVLFKERNGGLAKTNNNTRS